MKKSLFSIMLIIIGCLFLFHSFFSQYIVLKICGIIILMFSVYRLQAKIPSKSNTENDNFIKQEEE